MRVLEVLFQHLEESALDEDYESMYHEEDETMLEICSDRPPPCRGLNQLCTGMPSIMTTQGLLT